MTRTIWLASYPKSGNTWLRLLIANLFAKQRPVDINDLRRFGGIASARRPFDHLLLLVSGLLTLDEIDCLRPRVYEQLARIGADDDERTSANPVRFVKVHDAYTRNADGEPLLAGARGADGAIVVVRDPRDIAPSLAGHLDIDIGRAVAILNDTAAQWCATPNQQHDQFRQRLLNWSSHVGSWLEQTDIPVHLLRYEDLSADTAAVLTRAMTFAGLAVTRDEIELAVNCAGFRQLQQQERNTGFNESPRRAQSAFFRRGIAGGWREELTASQAACVEAAHSRLMRRLGYPLSTAPSLAPAS